MKRSKGGIIFIVYLSQIKFSCLRLRRDSRVFSLVERLDALTGDPYWSTKTVSIPSRTARTTFNITVYLRIKGLNFLSLVPKIAFLVHSD
jgi:hypothetical protein